MTRRPLLLLASSLHLGASRGQRPKLGPAPAPKPGPLITDSAYWVLPVLAFTGLMTALTGLAGH